MFRGEDNKENYKKMIELRAGLTSAKAAICIYGSSSVVKALAEFELAGSEIKTPAQERAFMAVLTAMRADVGLSPEGEALTAILLGGAPATKE
ncbi:hypothetical protein OCUBac02_32050 [Bosea sp. ANAM02]|nr:hypothetical protein OCUBac02_32050 [Bosea sp. ANAM02]